MLFEWLRDRWKEQAHLQIVSLKEFKMMNLTYYNFKNSILFFLYDPLSRVLSAFGVIMRFKKKIIHGALVRETLRPLILIPIRFDRRHPRSDTVPCQHRPGSNPQYVLQLSC
jgi:hypothetical protein